MYKQLTNLEIFMKMNHVDKYTDLIHHNIPLDLGNVLIIAVIVIEASSLHHIRNL